MRKGALFLLLGCVLCLLVWQVRGVELSKKVTATADKVNMAQLCRLVEQMAGIPIVAPIFEEGKLYSFNWKDAPLSKVLDEISYATGMLWELKHGRIIFKRRADTPTPELIQQREVQLKALVRFLLSLTERQNSILSMDALLPWEELSPIQKKLFEDCLGREFANFVRPYLYDQSEKALYIHPALFITLQGEGKHTQRFYLFATAPPPVLIKGVEKSKDGLLRPITSSRWWEEFNKVRRK